MRFSSVTLALAATMVSAARDGSVERLKRSESNSNLVYGTEVIGGTASYTTVVPISTHSVELYVSGGHMTTVSSNVFNTDGVTRTSSVWVWPDNELFTTVTKDGSTTTELASVLTTTSVSGVSNQVIWVSPEPPSSTKPTTKPTTTKPSSSSTTTKTSKSTSTSSSKTSKTTKTSSTTAVPKSTARSSTATSTTSTTSSSKTFTVTSASTTSLASISGVTANTKITTTDSSGSKTVVPVLFGCSFCGGGAIELFGGFGPAPGIYDWPDLPKFSGLPSIDIDESGDPSEDKSSTKPSKTTTSTSKSTSSSSSSCTRSSVTRDIHVTCTVETASGQSTASKTCKTVTETVTGCNLHATDSTTTTTSTGACWTYTGVPITPNDDPSEADNSDDASTSSKKRSIAGRIEFETRDDETSVDNSTVNYLESRGTGSIKNFGSCQIGTTSNGVGISYPNWPAAKVFQSKTGLNAQQFWWLVDPTTCPNVAELKWNNGVKLTKSVVTNGKQSSDHAYEKGLVGAFLTSVLGSADSTTCSDFNDVFVATADGQWAEAGPPNNKENQGNPNVKGQCRLQSLYNALPNQMNNAFVGVDQNVNSMKGKFFNEALDGFPNIASGSSDAETATNLNIWNEMGMALGFLRESVVIEQYQVGNAAIFGALNRFDELWSTCSEKTPLNLGTNYQSYMSKLYETNMASIAAKATAVSNSLIAHAVTTYEGGAKNNYYTAIQNLEKTFPIAEMTFPTASYLSFPATTDNNIKRGPTVCSTTGSVPTISQTSTATTGKSGSGSTTTKASTTKPSGSTTKPSTTTTKPSTSTATKAS